MTCIKNIISFLVIVSQVLCYHCRSVHSIIGTDGLLYAKDNIITKAEILKQLSALSCTGIKYTEYLRIEGCLRVPVENIICGGKCKEKGKKCVPTKLEEKTIYPLCKDAADDESKRVFKTYKTTVIKECGCVDV